MRRVVLVTAAVVALTGPLAAAEELPLPTPDAARVQQSQLIKAVGGRPDRLLASAVPGPVVNDEVVRVGLGGGGDVTAVTADQRLQLRGVGDYAVRERGPARSAVPLGDEPPPVTRRGAVVWQGFSPGRRDLAARLVLDPQIEAPHLPLSVAVAFTGRDGRTRPLGDGGRVPAAGTVTVTLTNTTEQPALLPTAADAPAAALAGPLDRALAVARRPGAARLPSTDDVLPATVPVTAAARQEGAQSVALHLTGSLRLSGTAGQVTGPAVVAGPGSGTFGGTLGGPGGTRQVVFQVRADGPGVLALDLTAVNALDPRLLAPPDGSPTWRAWAAAGPGPEQRRAALDLLVQVAAAGARAASYSPYLGADLEGTGSTTFRWAFAPAVRQAAVQAPLQPRWGAIALAGVAALLLAVNGALLWRRA